MYGSAIPRSAEGRDPVTAMVAKTPGDKAFLEEAVAREVFPVAIGQQRARVYTEANDRMFRMLPLPQLKL